eukprot:gene2806-3060_t
MIAFGATTAVYLQYQRLRWLQSLPHLITHYPHPLQPPSPTSQTLQSDNEGETEGEGEGEDSIDDPPPAYVNLYCNASEQSEDTLWWPSLVHDVIQTTEHAIHPLEVIDYFGQLQTALFSIGRHCVRLAKEVLGIRRTVYHRELVVMSDEGTIALDWVGSSGSSSSSSGHDRPLVLMLHGICGDSQAEYIYHFAEELYETGYQPVVMVARGCGGLAITSPTLFAATIPFDLYECIHHLQERFGSEQKIFAIGYSLGAASLFHYVALCKDRRPSGLSTAICVSPPWCFRQTVTQPTIIGTLWSILISLPLKLHYLSHVSELKKMSKEFNTIHLFDILFGFNTASFDRVCHHTYHKMDRSCITLATEGKASWIDRGHRRYHDVLDYYESTSPSGMVGDVDTPTLVISAIDDPLCIHEYCPRPRFFSPHLVVAKTFSGGHLAFPDGNYLYKGWTDQVIHRLLNHQR